MGFKNRMGFLIKSEINHWIMRAEEPEKIVNQALEEIEEGIEHLRSRLVALKTKVEKDERILQEISKQISYWQAKAEEYIRDSMEENAKEALRIKRILEKEKRIIEFTHKEDEIKRDKMSLGLKKLEDRAQVAKAKRNLILHKIKFYKGVVEEEKEKMGSYDNELGFEIKSPFSVINKIEERIQNETAFDHLIDERKRELCEKEERLIDEEIQRMKKNIIEGEDNK
ncbi:PspA/IM30 family protein [Desulfobacterota bacterium AH_259_B03_O07]|nr:PspA/IM30 family protein [Desulfobacterota bacterium AH_259_B03_O07]